MFNISKYLEKFKKSIESGEVLNESIVEIIKKHTGISLTTNDFEIKNNIIYINSSPIIKNKIFIFKSVLKEDIKSKTSVDFSDIR